MQESKREKFLRFLLIGICLLVVLGGFLYSSSSDKVEEIKPSIHAEVLSRGDESRNPVIAVAKMLEEQPVLVIYEIDQKNQYYFKVLHSVSLHKPVKTLRVTKEHNGIWVQMEEKKWILFSEGLEVLQERESDPSTVTSSGEAFQIQKDTGLISISRGSRDVQLDLTDKSGEPKEIHSLSGDDSVWLVVFQKDMVLARSR
ncbi:hypothetical protein [Rossellomorea sp. LJF3]|uniref:hypothetical protein n=1 Tax=Rossellomorea sp. LJF3 TaxID=3126099 RepID=UPI00300D84E8